MLRTFGTAKCKFHFSGFPVLLDPKMAVLLLFCPGVWMIVDLTILFPELSMFRYLRLVENENVEHVHL